MTVFKAIMFTTIIIVVSGLSRLHAQDTWVQTYGESGDEIPFSILSTYDGRYLVGGIQKINVSPYNGWLLNIDSLGTLIWEQAYGPEYGTYVYSMVQTLDQGYLLAGSKARHVPNYYPTDFWVSKLDHNGEELWNFTYDIDNADAVRSVINTSDGGYLMVGGTGYMGSGNYWIAKISTTGELIWERSYAGEWGGYAFSVVQTSEQNYVVAGAMDIANGQADYFLVKITTDGDTLWTRSYDGGRHDWARSIISDVDDCLLVAGYSSILGDGSVGQMLLYKLDSEGEVLWSHTYDRGAEARAYSVISTSDNGYLLTGCTGNYQSKDIYLVRVDTAGDTLWTRTLGGSEKDVGYASIYANDGGYVVVGETESFGSGGADFFLAKTDANGNVSMPVAITESSQLLSPLSVKVFPNPANGMCSINFSLNNEGSVSICIFDIKGRIIWNKMLENRESGSYNVDWQTVSNSGKEVTSGIYLLSISTSRLVENRKIVITK